MIGLVAAIQKAEAQKVMILQKYKTSKMMTTTTMIIMIVKVTMMMVKTKKINMWTV